MPRYSTTSAVPWIVATMPGMSPSSRCSGRKPTITLLLAAARASWYWPGSGKWKPPWCSSVCPAVTGTSTKFIDGLPMKPATNRFFGLSYRSCGVPTCCSRPSLMTAIRWPIVIASTWSWVT